MSKYKIALWDLDGTLLDTGDGIIASVFYTIQKEELPTLSKEELQKFIGPPVQDSFQRMYQVDKKEADRLAAVFRQQYKEVDLLKAVPYDNIYDILTLLRERGVKIAVATYKREDYALRLLTHYNFDRYCDIIHGSDLEGRLSKADIIRLCIKEAGVSTDEAVMIGDTCHDAKGAAELGIDFIGVLYGFGFVTDEEKQQYPAIGWAETPLEVEKFIFKSL